MSNTDLFTQIGLNGHSASNASTTSSSGEVHQDSRRTQGGLPVQSTSKRSHDSSEDETAPATKRRRIGGDSGTTEEHQSTGESSGAGLLAEEGDLDTDEIHSEAHGTSFALDPTKNYSARFVGNGPVYIANLEVDSINVTAPDGTTMPNPIILYQSGPFIPANSQLLTLRTLGTTLLAKTGDKIEINLIGQLNNNANAKTIVPVIGGTNLLGPALPINSGQPFKVVWDLALLSGNNCSAMYTWGAQGLGVNPGGNATMPIAPITSATTLALQFDSNASTSMTVYNIVAILYRQL